MATVTISPNMNLPIPVVGQELAPTWANDLNNSLSLIDMHNHAAGSGVQVHPDGLDIDADLTFNNTNSAIALKTVRFFPQLSPIAASSPNLGCLYEAGVDLYYNDGAGNQVRITSGGAVAGAAGTITGLPSGTASASYQSASGTFQFQQATNTAANIDVATVIIRYPGSYPTPAGNYIALEAPVALATGYAFILPAALPGTSGAMITSDTSGNISYTNPDNSTLQITSSLIQIKDHGVTQVKKALMTTGSTVVAGGYAISSSSGSFSSSTGSYVAVTNLSVTITTTGRPVKISLGCASAVADCFIAVASASGIAQASFQISNNATPISQSMLRTANTGPSQSINVPPSCLLTTDFPVAGTYTYTVEVKPTASSTITVENCQLEAYEI